MAILLHDKTKYNASLWFSVMNWPNRMHRKDHELQELAGNTRPMQSQINTPDTDRQTDRHNSYEDIDPYKLRRVIDYILIIP